MPQSLSQNYGLTGLGPSGLGGLQHFPERPPRPTYNYRRLIITDGAPVRCSGNCLTGQRPPRPRERDPRPGSLGPECKSQRITLRAFFFRADRMCAEAYNYLLVPNIALLEISQRWPQAVAPCSWESVHQLAKLMRLRFLPLSGKVEMWRGGGRLNISVSASFV